MGWYVGWSEGFGLFLNAGRWIVSERLRNSQEQAGSCVGPLGTDWGTDTSDGDA